MKAVDIMSIVKDTRSCGEWKAAPGYEGYNKVPCAAFQSWDKTKCMDIDGVKLRAQRYEDSPVFDTFNRMMQDSKSIVI